MIQKDCVDSFQWLLGQFFVQQLKLDIIFEMIDLAVVKDDEIDDKNLDNFEIQFCSIQIHVSYWNNE